MKPRLSMAETFGELLLMGDIGDDGRQHLQLERRRLFMASSLGS